MRLLTRCCECKKRQAAFLNLKIGDDSAYIMDVFEEFLADRERRRALHLWLHTVHLPHPAMPEWFHAYQDAHGAPAGDYLGTLSQMDAQIG